MRLSKGVLLRHNFVLVVVVVVAAAAAAAVFVLKLSAKLRIQTKGN
jgi:hypothetical protein